MGRFGEGMEGPKPRLNARRWAPWIIALLALAIPWPAAGAHGYLQDSPLLTVGKGPVEQPAVQCAPLVFAFNGVESGVLGLGQSSHSMMYRTPRSTAIIIAVQGGIGSLYAYDLLGTGGCNIAVCVASATYDQAAYCRFDPGEYVIEARARDIVAYTLVETTSL